MQTDYFGEGKRSRFDTVSFYVILFLGAYTLGNIDFVDIN